MAAPNPPLLLSLNIIVILTSLSWICRLGSCSTTPTPTPWPHQFHSLLFVNTTDGYLSQIDLWYDWTNGRNVNIIRDQLAGAGTILYDVEWNNGTSFFHNSSSCWSVQLDVGILRPDWLVDGSNYLGQRRVNGFLCNVWEKVEFIWYYEDVVTKRPVQWVFYTGRSIHVMTFEVGEVLEDEKWQAPFYCFDNKAYQIDAQSRWSLELSLDKRKHDLMTSC